MSETSQFDINKVIADAKSVITNPVGYYQSMPKTGGFTEPLIFVAVMAAIMGIITAVLSLFGSSAAGVLAAGFSAIILMPIFAVIGAFIGAAILFVIWKLMGSPENYETAFRSLAAITAIYPIIAVLSIIPYVGTIVGIIWATWLLIEASVAVHGRNRQTASIVFGILGLLMLISNVSTEYATRNAVSKLEQYQSSFEQLQHMDPDEAGRKLGEFLKGIEQGMTPKE
ncbi:MAG: YIP1 family protein [Porticoccaceae bacterium]|nr:YIP1 family protein [Porticoccaceae bacterium]